MQSIVFFFGKCNRHTFPALVSLSAFLVLSALDSRAQTAAKEEFTGPFPSWINVKTKYGAAGDGTRDDTEALQKAFSEIGTKGYDDLRVVYLPAGTYRITAGLTMSARQNISVIGEDPATTRIRWDGASGGTMFLLNGVNHSRFARLTWDGAGKAATAVAHQWDGTTGTGGSTHNEHADEAFVDVGQGLRGGKPHLMDAEMAVLRCRFIRNSVAGISVESFNALNWYVWDSYFEDCEVGVTNNPPTQGAGNFHVFQCVFKRSKYADITIRNTLYFSVRDNFSVGSKAFFVGEAIGQNAALMTLQKNVILDFKDPTPIRLANKGPLTLIDNVIRSAPGQAGPVVVCHGDVLSVGNIFTVNAAVSAWERLITFDDEVRSASSLTLADYGTVQSGTIQSGTEPVLPGTPPKRSRRVFEVSPGWDHNLQKIVDSAAALVGQRPVIHLRPGSYSLTNTLVIPPGADLQLVGDGFSSAISWFGAQDGTVLRLAGADRVVLRDFTVYGNYKTPAKGIVIEHGDQADKQVFMEGVRVWGANQTGVLMEGFRNTNVELHDFSHSSNPSVAIKVVGPPGQGVASRGRMGIFGGASSNNALSYEVANGGRLMAQDIWYEGSPKGFVKLTDSGVFTLNGARIAAYNGSEEQVDINNFNGNATFLGVHMNGKFLVQGEGTNANVLAAGMQFDVPNAYVNRSPRAKAFLLNSRTYAGGSYPVGNSGEADPAFIRKMLEQVRTERPLYKTASGGLTMYRVQVAQTSVGIHLLPAQGPAIPDNPACAATGTIRREVWYNIGGGNSVAGLPTASPPGAVSQLDRFEAPSEVADNYGSRIRGYLCPPTSGPYVFWIAADDNAELWLSTDDNPANRQRLAAVDGWTRPRQWDKLAGQQSAPRRLEAGRRYYVEALHKEGVGFDNLAVGWRTPTMASVEAPVVVPGSALSPFVPPATACAATGTILREQWNGVGGGYQVNTIPVNTTPASSRQLTSFEAPSNAGDNYGARLRGYLCAPETGGYVFWIASDDHSELYLASDENPAGKVRIAFLNRAVGFRKWEVTPDQRSAVVQLVAGQKYYIEALHKEAWVNDHCSVGWRRPSMSDTAPPEVIPGGVLSPFVLANGRVAPAEPTGETVVGIQVYPNPFTDRVTIEFGEGAVGPVEVTLYDQLGRLIHRSGPVRSNAPKLELDFSQEPHRRTDVVRHSGGQPPRSTAGMSTGMYFLKVRSGVTSKTIKLIRIAQ
ncbi:MAG: hypothetical protein H7Z75_11700 [Ferruginibacter sp.]|nr:hypothetical protein [Cytophagales bacterium]